VAIQLEAGSSSILDIWHLNIPGTAVTGAVLLYESNWVDLGAFGYLSSAANNVLNINLGSAFTAGGVDVFVIGTEE
jgi:hypothetical protein